MTVLKKIIMMSVVLILMLIDVLIYLNHHLYMKAQNELDQHKKVEILQKAFGIYPFNPLVYYELGKANLELGTHPLQQREMTQSYLLESERNFIHSIRMNPVSHFSHFYFARTIFYLNIHSIPVHSSYYDEYKKAASLVSLNSQIYLEVGKIFLSRWSELSNKDREFTLDMLKEIFQSNDYDKIYTILNVWELNVRDYTLIRQILPEKPEVLRLYAGFLGEKSLSLGERQHTLTMFESLQFESAKEFFKQGEIKYYQARIGEAADDFKTCLNMLNKIRFYQHLTQTASIDVNEFNELRKFTWLNIAKSSIQTGKEWGTYHGYLMDFLLSDPSSTQINELSNFLESWRLMGREFERNPRDTSHLYFMFLLYYKQNRYADIIKEERLHPLSQISTASADDDLIIKILHILGDAHQKIGNLYDALDVNSQAYEKDPTNIITLLKMRKTLDLLGEKRRVTQINTEIEELLMGRFLLEKRRTIPKGMSYVKSVLCDGRAIIFDFVFEFNEGEAPPLITVVFNTKVVWEGYLEGRNFSIQLNTILGTNEIRLVSVNRDLDLLKIKWREE